MLRGIFSRGSNVNIMESQYRLNPALIALGALTTLLFQSALLLIIYFALEATLSTTLIILILMAIGDISIIATTSYIQRLYLREEMIDMAMLFSSYNPQILDKGSQLIHSSYDALKIAKSDLREETELLYELRQLRDELKGKDDNGFIPLIGKD